MPQSVEEVFRQHSPPTSAQVWALSLEQVLSFPEQIKVLNVVQSSVRTLFGQPCVQLKQPAELVYLPVYVWKRSTNECLDLHFIKLLEELSEIPFQDFSLFLSDVHCTHVHDQLFDSSVCRQNFWEECCYLRDSGTGTAACLNSSVVYAIDSTVSCQQRISDLDVWSRLSVCLLSFADFMAPVS